ncbi:MAG TPA: 4Fe-4S dicluster domain-containing protein, partial [Thermoplasmatales archaeon]|nr:4Fe-4S dicluster domain-containing protein [Thermoplasmatales archaeon]
SVVERALNCMGCGVCTGQCRYGAIHIRDERAWIDGEKCIHCGECLNICPVVVFGRRENFAGKSK